MTIYYNQTFIQNIIIISLIIFELSIKKLLEALHLLNLKSKLNTNILYKENVKLEMILIFII